MKKLIFLFLILLTGLTFSTCGPEEDAIEIIVVTGVTLNQTSAKLSPGGSLQLTATVQPSNATIKLVTWSSSNNARASVSSSGKVTVPTGATAGSVVITVTTVEGGKKASCTVTVQGSPQVPVSKTVIADNVFVYAPDNGTTAEDNIIEYIPNERIVFKMPSTKADPADNSNAIFTNYNTGVASDLFPNMCISIPPMELIPDGALYKINDVQYGPGSVTAIVEVASWDDVVKEAAIDVKKRLFEYFPNEKLEVEIPIGDVTLKASFEKDFIKESAKVTLEAKYKLGTIPGTETDGTVNVIGSCEMDPTLEVRIHHTNGMGIPDIFDIRCSGEANLKLDFDIAAKIDIKATEPLKIMEIPLGAIPLVPVVFITPKLTLSMEIGVTGEVTLKFNLIDYKYQFDYYAGYDKGKWDRSVNTEGNHIEHNFPSFKLKSSIYVQLELALDFTIMNLEGAKLSVGGRIKPEAELEYNSLNNEMSVDISASASVFGKFDLNVLYKKAFGAEVKGELVKWNIWKFSDVVPGNSGQGVVINGITWATRNVDKPGTFAANPESPGMFYQWNTKVGWSATDPMINSNGGTTWNNNPTPLPLTTWEKQNDPCPIGWRVPTLGEFVNLINTGSVWTTCNSVYGRLFGVEPNQLFFPAAGARNPNLEGTLALEGCGYYWCSTLAQYSLYSASIFYFDSNSSDYDDSLYIWGNSVRCVAE